MNRGLYKTEAVVLRKRPLGEADCIVGLMSPTHGRLDAVGKGARKSKTSRAGLLEPFGHVRLLLARGRSLDVISQVEMLRTWRLSELLERVAAATYVLELFSELVELGAHGGAARIFASLQRTLDELESAAPTALDLACRRAELRLLTVLGTAPQLDVCVSCGAASPLVACHAPSGGTLCDGCRRPETAILGRETLPLLRLLRLAGTEVLPRADEAASSAARAEVEALLQRHIEWTWPTRLRSRRFVHQTALLPKQLQVLADVAGNPRNPS